MTEWGHQRTAGGHVHGGSSSGMWDNRERADSAVRPHRHTDHRHTDHCHTDHCHTDHHHTDHHGYESEHVHGPYDDHN